MRHLFCLVILAMGLSGPACADDSAAKAVDLGEKLALPDVVFGQAKAFQAAVIAVKGSVFGW